MFLSFFAIVCIAAADDSGIGGMQRSASRPTGRQPDRTVDDSVVQSTLSASFSRTVQDWERVRQSRGKSQSVSTSAAVAQSTAGAATKSTSTPATAVPHTRSKSRDRDKSHQRAEKELSKLAKKEQKLREEMQRLAATRIKLEAQLESSSASDRGSRGDSDRGEERLLAALDLLENVDDRSSDAFSDGQMRGRSKSTRVRRQSCMMTASTSDGFQRATSVGDPGRVKADRKSVSAAGPRYATAGTGTADENDSKRQQPPKPPPTSVNCITVIF